MVERCDGQLEVRHERQFGKVYTVCPVCERRVLEVGHLRQQVALLRQTIAELRRPSATQLRDQAREARRAERQTRNAEIERRYVVGLESAESIGRALGLSGQGVRDVLKARGVAIRPRVVATREKRVPGQPRVYRIRHCAKPACGQPFTPTGPHGIYCDSCRSTGAAGREVAHG
jgi:hypothetical protein